MEAIKKELKKIDDTIERIQSMNMKTEEDNINKKKRLDQLFSLRTAFLKGDVANILKISKLLKKRQKSH